MTVEMIKRDSSWWVIIVDATNNFNLVRTVGQFKHFCEAESLVNQLWGLFH